MLDEDEIEELGLADWTRDYPGAGELEDDEDEASHLDDDDDDDENLFMGWDWLSNLSQVAEIKWHGERINEIAMGIDACPWVSAEECPVADMIRTYLGELTDCVRALVEDSLAAPGYLQTIQESTNDLAVAHNNLLKTTNRFYLNPANARWVVRGGDQFIVVSLQQVYKFVRELTPHAVNARWTTSVVNGYGEILRR